MKSMTSLLLLAMLAACQMTYGVNDPISATYDDANPLERTWLMSRVEVPKAFTKSGQNEWVTIWKDPRNWAKAVEEKLKSPTTPMSTAVFLHGCTGFTYANTDFVNLLVSEGWAVFAPNSFARPGRKSRCYQQRGTFTYQQRQEEIAYALARLSEVSWTDRHRLVLVGHSEGGEAVGQWSSDGFTAVIISGANCDNIGKSVQAPSDVAALSLVGVGDGKEDVPCTVGLRGRGSKALSIPNIGHQVYQSDLAKQEIRQFLKTCCAG